MKRWGFNPCCDGTDSSTLPPHCRTSMSVDVSILVVMERTHRPDQAPGAIPGVHAVSILVVMERTHRRPGARRNTWRSCCFNPCCDGTDSSTRSEASRKTGPYLVSILVVMERTHRQWRRVQWGRSWGCFNPCCDGTDSSTPAPGPCRPRACAVSILVVMERTHRRGEEKGRRSSTAILFQSLL